MSAHPSREKRWPVKLRGLCTRAVTESSPLERSRMLGQSWLILDQALRHYLNRFRKTVSGVSEVDLEDIVADKSTELIGRIESGEWRLEGTTETEIMSYLSSVARGSMIAHLRNGISVRSDSGPGLSIQPHRPVRAGSRDRRDESHNFAEALYRCVNGLRPEWRRVWFLSAFNELSDKEIAATPGVGFKASHVEAILTRCNENISKCLEEQGYRSGQMPPGTMTELWLAFDRERAFLPSGDS
jgi:RNA polymerase sigma factor (sigma-70 family)